MLFEAKYWERNSKIKLNLILHVADLIHLILHVGMQQVIKIAFSRFEKINKKQKSPLIEKQQ